MTGYKSKRAAAHDKLAMTKDEALKLALEVLEELQGGCTDHDDGTVEAITVWCPEVISAIKKALAQPEQEPVAWLCKADKNGWFSLPTADEACKDCFPVYTAPPQRPWVGLTDDERLRALKFIDPKTARLPQGFKQFAESIEQLLKERNT